MKKPIITLLALGSMAFVFAGCLPTTTPDTTNDNTQTGSDNQIIEDNNTPEEPQNNGSPSALVTTGWSLTHSDYEVELLSGSAIPDIYVDADNVYEITHISDGRRTNLIISSESWNDVLNQRNSHIMPNLPTATGNLQDEAFNSYTIASLDWHQVAAPVDRVLLMHESPNHTFTLDFDDPSGMQNNMTMSGVQTMLQYFSVN